MTEELPAPLVPAEVDLRGLDYMPFFGNHLFGSEFNAKCSDAEWRAGVTLWWAAWNQQPAGSLPNDDTALCRMADLGRDMRLWSKLRANALRGFVLCADGRVYHEFLSKQVLIAWEKRVKERLRKAAYRAQQAEKKEGRGKDVPRDGIRDKPGTGGGTGRGQDADVPADGNGRDGTGRDGTTKSKASTASAAAIKPPDPVKDEIWKTGRQVLEGEGKSRDAAGSFLGKLCKDYGQVLVLKAIRDCVTQTPAKPSEWLVARCQERQANAANKQLSLEERNRQATAGWKPPELREGNAI